MALPCLGRQGGSLPTQPALAQSCPIRVDRAEAGRSSQEWPPSPFLPAACPHGRFGPGCAYVCGCGQGAACDPVTGSCSCPPGRTGVHCEHGEKPLACCLRHFAFITTLAVGGIGDRVKIEVKVVIE